MRVDDNEVQRQIFMQLVQRKSREGMKYDAKRNWKQQEKN